jgi:protein involved in polysaccharide export with SLBB domain
VDHWLEDGYAIYINTPDLIRRHYNKPKPAHKLDLKPGDVVELVAWEDGSLGGVGKEYKYGNFETVISKGHRPLFKVVSRFSWTTQPS